MVPQRAIGGADALTTFLRRKNFQMPDAFDTVEGSAAGRDRDRATWPRESVAELLKENIGIRWDSVAPITSVEIAASFSRACSAGRARAAPRRPRPIGVDHRTRA